MTRRNVVFKDKDGTLYSTPEFNGDGAEYDRRGMTARYGDWCSIVWSDAICIFEGIRTKEQFSSASDELQGCYHSSLGDQPPEPIFKIDSIETLNSDEIYFVENGVLTKERKINMTNFDIIKNMTLEEAGKVIWLGVHGHAEDVINWLKKESTDGEIVD